MVNICKGQCDADDSTDENPRRGRRFLSLAQTRTISVIPQLIYSAKDRIRINAKRRSLQIGRPCRIGFVTYLFLGTFTSCSRAYLLRKMGFTENHDSVGNEQNSEAFTSKNTIH